MVFFFREESNWVIISLDVAVVQFVLVCVIYAGRWRKLCSSCVENSFWMWIVVLFGQTLDQIGSHNNIGDALGSYVQAQAGAGEGSLARRPLGLNCATAFQAWPVNNINIDSSIQASQQGRQPHQWAWTIQRRTYCVVSTFFETCNQNPHIFSTSSHLGASTMRVEATAGWDKLRLQDFGSNFTRSSDSFRSTSVYMN